MPKRDIKKYATPIAAFLLVSIFFFAVILISIKNENKNETRAYEKELKEIMVNGTLYIFNTNLYETIKVQSDSENEIKNIFERSAKLCINFDNSSSEDNSAFLISSFNIVYKILRYYNSRGMEKKIEVCNEEPKIELRGPNTGAIETSVRLVNRTIIVQGTTAKKLEMAADKLILIIFGIKEI